MRIKLTTAQMEIVAKHSLVGYYGDPVWIEPVDINQLVEQISAVYADVQTWKYSEALAREIFATRSLHTKITKLAEPQPEPEPAPPIEVGATVYAVHDTSIVYRVVKFNVDGSVQVYGGESPQYRKYRDLPLDALTTVK